MDRETLRDLADVFEASASTERQQAESCRRLEAEVGDPDTFNGAWATFHDGRADAFGTAATVLRQRAMRAEAGSATFDRGFQLGAQVEQRATREALAAFVLEVLGKDRADGEVDLGALGRHFARSRQ